MRRSKLTEKDLAHIRRCWLAGDSCAVIARDLRYVVGASAISYTALHVLGLPRRRSVVQGRSEHRDGWTKAVVSRAETQRRKEEARIAALEPAPTTVPAATLWRCPECGQLTPLAAGAAIPQRCPHTQQEAA